MIAAVVGVVWLLLSIPVALLIGKGIALADRGGPFPRPHAGLPVGLALACLVAVIGVVTG